jgi:quinol monooxygenase YgiN
MRIEKRAIEIYLQNGCISVEIYRDAEDPERWMEINRFENREHYERVSATLDADPRLSRLFEEFQNIFENENYEPEKSMYFQMI